MTISNFEVWLRRKTGDLVASLFASRPGVSLIKKYELVRFYLSVSQLRMKLGEDHAGIEKVTNMAEWERLAFDTYGGWPFGERGASWEARGARSVKGVLWRKQGL